MFDHGSANSAGHHSDKCDDECMSTEVENSDHATVSGFSRS